MSSITRERVTEALRSTGITLLITLVTLVALEGLLRLVSPRMLRDSSTERSLTYQYDPELGWMPVPHSSAVIRNARAIHAQHNSLGLRDIEFVRDGRPAMLV